MSVRPTPRDVLLVFVSFPLAVLAFLFSLGLGLFFLLDCKPQVELFFVLTTWCAVASLFFLGLSWLLKDEPAELSGD